MQQQGLHKPAGHQTLTAFTFTPQNIQVRKTQGVLPGRTLGVSLGLARWQAQQLALQRGPQAGGLGRHRQVLLVATGQHHRLRRTTQKLAQRQDDDLRLRRMHRFEISRLQRLVDPAAEVTQVHAPGIGELCLGTIVQAQGIQHRLPCPVAGQPIPLACAVQGGTQVAQPQGQSTGALQPVVHSLHLPGDCAAGRQVLAHSAPITHAGLAQLFFGRRHLRRVKSRGIFQPVQQRVGTGLPAHGTQQAHQRRCSAGGGQLPAGFVAYCHPALAEHGAHTARQPPVLRNQRDRAAPLRQLRQHAGGCALCFVFGVQRRMQGRQYGLTRGIECQHHCALAEMGL